MNSQSILDSLEVWARNRDFSAPYGILTGSHVNSKGKKYLSITFGRARTLDATVEIYNRNFLILRTSSRGTEIFKSVAELQQMLDTL